VCKPALLIKTATSSQKLGKRVTDRICAAYIHSYTHKRKKILEQLVCCINFDFMSLHYAIAYRFFLYGASVWSNTSITLLTPIHILQKKFVRMATYNDGFQGQSGPLIHSPPLFSMFNLLTVVDIFKLQVGKIVYESVNCIGPMINILVYTPASEIHNHETSYASHRRFFIHTMRTHRFGFKNPQNEGR